MTAMTINIYTATPRHEALQTIKDAALSATGWIAGHAFYSNTAATLHAVIERNHLGEFLDVLIDQNFTREDDASVQLLRTMEKSGDNREVNVTCAITFQHDDPDLRHHVAAVPG
ncbi:MAG: hypothetical protein HWE25_02090 [Alphaproteobacteria bacterium]|nr:hypothetical protein [Alphaproteobacteria bacterium]